MSPTPHMEKRFEEHLATHGLVQPGQSILLAISGGIDSMVMLSLFNGLKKQWGLTLGVLHVNHMLRGKESEGDEAFVRRSAAALELPVFVKQTDTDAYAERHHCARQEAAREIRYSFFEATRLTVGANSVATAHQANDNAETVLMNSLRGAGVRGLSGIPLRRDPAIIRPLLFAYRAEIESFARENSVDYREDSSNASSKYLRNYLRNQVIPEIQKYSDALESLNRISDVMRSLGSRIEAEVRNKEKDFLEYSPSGSPRLLIPALLREPVYLQEEFILHVLRMSEIEPSTEKVSTIIRLCTQQTGRSHHLGAGMSVYRDRDFLVFVPPDAETEFAMPVEIGGNYEIGDYRFSLERATRVPKELGKKDFSEFIDAERLGSRLILRSWKTGDRFVPLGMKTAKKVSDFFTDQKVSLIEKSRIPLFESDGTIVWVCGKRLDDRFKVTPATRTAVKLSYRPLRAQ